VELLRLAGLVAPRTSLTAGRGGGRHRGGAWRRPSAWPPSKAHRCDGELATQDGIMTYRGMEQEKGKREIAPSDRAAARTG
jgi:hypothetical protein